MLIAFRFSLLTFILFGLVYPLAMTGLGQVLFPAQANGSLLKNAQGHVIGSSLVAQNFSDPQYFYPQPSVNDYDAANSGGSNLGATSKKLVERIVVSSREYQQQNTGQQAIPIDAVTASASGLDPHISLANAMAQASRVAQARKLDSDTVKKLVLKVSENPLLASGPYVNVLQLNLTLDRQK